VFILAFAFIIISSNTYRFSFAKSDTVTSDKSIANTVDTNDGKKQFDQFGKCLSVIADNKDFATEKEIKACVTVVYDSDSSKPSTSATTSSSLMNKDDSKK
jgi:hypothetical protein